MLINFNYYYNYFFISSFFLLFLLFPLVTSSPQHQQNDVRDPSCGSISVTETSLDGLLTQVEWIGTEGLVFSLTVHGTLYRSTDNGKTWKNQTDNLPIPPLSNISHFISKIIPITSSESQLIIMGTSNSLWKSYDNGVTFQYFEFELKDQHHNNVYPLFDIIPHPIYSDWLLAVDSNPLPTVYVSKDFGDEWNVVSSYTSQYFWPYPHQDPSPTVDVTGAYLLSYQIDDNTNYDTLRLDGLSQLLGYDSTFLNYGVLLNDIRQLSVYKLTMAAVVYPNGDIKQAKVVFSLDGGFHWSDLTVASSKFNISNSIVEIAGVSDTQIHLSMTEGNDQAYNWAYLLSAHFDHKILNPSQYYILRSPYFGPEVSNLPDLSSTYLNNKYYFKETSSNTLQNLPVKFDYPIISEISFNQVNDWQSIDAPDCNSLCDNGRKCSLHLSSLKDSKYFSSPETAVGLIIAAGNKGCSLAKKNGLYISRDGGWKWIELSSEEQAFGVGDHASFILFASLGIPTSYFRYTTDYGNSLHSCVFAERDYFVSQIHSPKSAVGSSFLMIVSNHTNVSLFHLDFSNYFDRMCQGVDIAGQPESDYELWAASSQAGQQCYNGETHEHSRRKSNAQCFNGEEYEPHVQSVPCKCTSADYGCAVCYERRGGRCVKSSNYCTMESKYDQPSNCDGQWIKPSAYEKLPGNQCSEEGSGMYADTLETCEDTSESTNSTLTGIIFVFILLFLVAFFATLFVFLFKMYRDKKEYEHKKVESQQTELSEF